MDVQFYYCGLNILEAGAPQAALATPVRINLCPSGDGVASGSCVSACSEKRPRKEAMASFPKTQFRVALSWTSLYLVIDGKLSIVGEGGRAAIPSAELAVKDVAASWASVFLLTDDSVLVTSDAEFVAPARRLEVGLHATGSALRGLAAGEGSVLVLGESGEVFASCAVEGSPCFRSLSVTMRVKSVDCGKEHAMLLTQLGQVYTYGSGSRGQLGHGGIDSEDAPRLIEALDGLSVLCVSAGGWHSAAVSDIGDIYVWGWNESGQLGLPCRKLREQTLERGVAAASASSDDIVTVLALPQVLFAEDDDLTFVDVSCGSRHTVALTADRRLFAWGWNDYGQLGTGDLEARDSPCEVHYFTDCTLQPVKVKCGYWSTVVVCTSAGSGEG